MDDGDSSKYTLKELQKICKKAKPPVPLNITHPKIIKGWSGKAKGLLQIIWERGFIDASKITNYNLHAWDSDEECIPEYSLVDLMKSCTDFMEELSQLEAIGENLGVKVITTTKYHAEIAGEGIEYSWGSAKSMYRKIPLGEKKGKENFHELVRRCISRDNVLTTKCTSIFDACTMLHAGILCTRDEQRIIICDQ